MATAWFASPRSKADWASASGLDAWDEWAGAELGFWRPAIAELKQNNRRGAVITILRHHSPRSVTLTISPGSLTVPSEALQGGKWLPTSGNFVVLQPILDEFDYCVFTYPDDLVSLLRGGLADFSRIPRPPGGRRFLQNVRRSAREVGRFG